MAEQKKKKRTSTGKAGQDVLKEYNHRCAVCGADRPHVHHIDEDPSNRDPLNLLPLCPNCHLSDQHNPTAKIDPGLLRLFRKYKDPVILGPQFAPLYKRMRFLENAQVTTLDQFGVARKELIEFIGELEMGSFYAQQVARLLEVPNFPVALSRWRDPRYKQELQERRAANWASYLHHVLEVRDRLEELVLELVRYQNWLGPARKLTQSGHIGG